MIFIDAKGKPKKLNNSYKYFIDWDGKSRSLIQEKVKRAIKEIWYGMPVYEEFPVIGTRLTLDFYNRHLSVAIEVQGNQHIKHIPFFHGDSKLTFVDQLKRDRQKRDFCEKNTIQLIQIFEKDAPKISPSFIQSLINGPT